MRRLLRIAYALIALALFLSLVVLGIVLLVRPDLAGDYLWRVTGAIVAGAVILLVADRIARRLDR